jgi:PAS domain S-box-containing protein
MPRKRHPLTEAQAKKVERERAPPSPRTGARKSHRVVTEPNRAEEALRQSETEFRQLFENAIVGIYWSSPEGRLLRVNPALAAMYGYAGPDAMIAEVTDAGRQLYADPGDRMEFARLLAERGVIGPREYHMIRRDGTRFWVLETSRAVRDADGKLLHFEGTCIDITERKRAEEALWESEGKYRNIVEQSMMGIGISKGNQVIFANRALLRMFNYDDSEEFKKIPLINHIAPSSRKLIADRVKMIAEGKIPPPEFEYDISCKGGLTKTLRAYSAHLSLGGESYTQTLFLDITERKRTAEELERSRSLLEAALESTADGILVVDKQGKITRFNRKFAEMWRIPPDILAARDDNRALAFVLEQLETPENFLRKVEELYAQPEAESFDVLRFKDGRSFERYSQPQHLGQDIVGRVWSFRDVTTRRRAEERIQEQAALLDHATDAIYVTALDCTILYWNKAAERIYGWSAAEAVNRRTAELISPDAAAVADLLNKLLQQGDWSSERQQLTKAGRQVDVLSRLTLMRDEQGRPRAILVINTDITEKKKLEAQFLRAQRLESVGALASGIAHDLNNVLSPIVLGAQILRESVSDNTARSLLETIERSAKRGADIVQQVLTFARGSAGQHVSLQLRHLLREMVAIAEETFPKNIKIEAEMPDDVWPIEGDPTQLHQALMNLCVNARDAMPEGGTLTLAAANVTIDEATAAQTPGATPGRFVRVCVTDTGGGIPPEVAARLFEPFFTTKGVGKGTGLGLSTVLGILKGHRGFIRLDTQMGRGTTFELYLPAALVAVADARPGTARPWPRAGGELVLLVDDEAPVREVARQALEEFGYRVISCAAGADAVNQFNAACGEVQLVVTDMMMPEMDGPALVNALRAIEPGIRIVGITGVADTATINRLHALALTALLTKPFTIGQLLTTVREAQNRGTERAPPPPDP